MRTDRAFASLSAFMLVFAAVSGAAAFGSEAPEPVRDAAGSISPVGEAQALGLTASIVGGVVIGTVACDTVIKDVCDPNHVSEEEMAKADALETHKEIYARLAGVEQSKMTTVDAFNNHLQDTQEVALMEGKHAYIRALNNGSAEATAEARASEAIAQYYSERQLTLRASWNASAYTLWNAQETALNTSNLVPRDVVEHNGTGNHGPTSQSPFSVDDGVVQKVTLVNGTEVPVQGIVDSTGSAYISDQNVLVNTGALNTSDYNWTGIKVFNATGNTAPFVYLDFRDYSQAWDEIEAQNDQVQSELSTFVSNTFDEYQQGEINNSDLVDPYLASREYSPEANFGTWALRHLSAMGLAPPENLSDLGSMTVEHDGETFEGILMSDGLPTNDTFEVGKTYNADNLAGEQFMAVTESERLEELDGPFTVQNATTADGETLDVVKYRNQTYETTSVDGYKDRLGDLQNTTAQINARQQRLRQGAAGAGLVIPGFGTVGMPALIASLALIMAVLLGLLAVRRS